jgi:dGTPase
LKLARYAADATHSRGRLHSEEAPRYRNEFQRDRDRVIHSAAFRRLEYKTQVFVNHEGDMFRTRLTHSLEVAQIARSVSRVLRLNEDLTEAIALAHDLGHTPFGHAGQDALNECMRPYGGFEHNLQSLRVVDLLEQRYAAFVGLNLSYETREGILKHCSRANARTLGELGKRFLERHQPSLEAQVTDLADAVAYNNHDVDDSLRAGLVDVEELREVELFRDEYDDVLEEWPDISSRRVIHEVVRRMINTQITDLIETTRALLEASAPDSIDDVRKSPQMLVAFSPSMGEKNAKLKRFLHQHVYKHERVTRNTVDASRIVIDLFHAFVKDPGLLPDHERAQTLATQGVDPDAAAARRVADYIAGMTDRYAISEARRLLE